MKQIFALLKKYREVLLYLVFGVLTTLVNIFCYALFARLFGLAITPSTALAWVISVVFAYLTNRTWVFQSKAAGWRARGCEIATFFGGRALSGLLDLAIMSFFAEYMGIHDMFVKIASNILVIILNYVISKWIVFRKKEPK